MGGAKRSGTLRYVRQLFDSGTLSGLSDRQLLDRFTANRDEAAFEQLMARHGRMVLAVALGSLDDRSIADDVYQAVFLVLVDKAHAIRGDQSLAAWIYRITQRISRQANLDATRAHRRLQRAGELKSLEQSSEMDRELQQMLHSEVARLPEKYRQPLTLCYFESLSYSQAAEKLACTDGLVRKRLERARSLLRSRLTRLGFALALVEIFEVLEKGSAEAGCVAPNLQKATVRSALLVSAGKSLGEVLSSRALVRIVRASMRLVSVSPVKLGLAAGASLLCLVVAGGSIASLAQRETKGQQSIQAAMEKKAGKEPVAGKAAVKPGSKPLGETIQLRGMVRTPDGKPYAGAMVVWDRTRDVDANKQKSTYATSGSDGSFVLDVEKKPLLPEKLAQFADILYAFGPGFAPGWQTVHEGNAQKLELSLEPDVPVHGKLVDLEGRPVAGARITPLEILTTRERKLDSWLTLVSRGKDVRPVQVYGALVVNLFCPKGGRTETVVTDAQGAFVLPGVGPERVVRVRIEGNGIVSHENVYVITKPHAPFTPADDPVRVEFEGGMFFGQSFEFACAPSRDFLGELRDSGTGKPIPGATIASQHYPGKRFEGLDVVKTKTDEEGRFTLKGLPAKGVNVVRIEGPKGEPFALRLLDLADEPGLGPVRVSATLTKGAWIEGKVVDKRTKEGVGGVRIQYFPFKDNEHLSQYANLGFNESRSYSALSDEKGSFRLFGLLGHGLIAARADELTGLEFASGEGAEAIHSKTPAGAFATALVRVEPKDYQSFVEINPEEPGGRISVSVVMNHGLERLVRLVDPRDKPIPSSRMLLISTPYAPGRELNLTTNEVQIGSLNPANPRMAIASTADRSLRGFINLRGDEAEPVLFKLQPSGAVKGRLIDPEGSPLANIKITWSGCYPGTEFPIQELDNTQEDFVQTNEKGEFVIKNLVPGLECRLWIWPKPTFGGVSTDIRRRIEPGKTFDLGEVKFKAQAN